MIWKELFDVKKPKLSEAEELALAHSTKIEKQIEACRSRFESIEVLLRSSSRDALILCRHLHGDLRRAFTTMHSGKPGSKGMNPDAIANALLKTTGKWLDAADSEEHDVRELRKTVNQLKTVRNGLVRTFDTLKKEKLWTPLQTYKRRVRYQLFILFAVVVLGVSIAVEIQSSRREAAMAEFGRLYDLGVDLTNSGEHAEAEAVYREALVVLPDHPRSADAYNNLGWALANLERYREAMEAFEAALALRPDYELARNNLESTRIKLNAVSK